MVTTRIHDDADSVQTLRRGFVLGQVRGLQPLELVTFIAPSNQGSREPGPVAVDPTATSAALTVGLGGGCPPTSMVQTSTGSEPNQVASLVTSVLDGPFFIADDAPLDVRHSSRRPEVELERMLVRVREWERAFVGSRAGADAATTDPDGNLAFSFEGPRVWVGARVLASTETVVRVFALVAVEVDSSPALGQFLAQANFALGIGKLSLDAVHRVVWFEETLGEAFSDDELRCVIVLVAMTTNEYDDHIVHMFFGRIARESASAAPEDHDHGQPASSGYL